jgi:hypothetical protein
VRQREDLEAAREALAEPALDEQRRRAQQHHLEWKATGAIFVPQPFDCLRPARHLLDLVEGENGPPAARFPGEESRGFPLLLDPASPSQRGLVGGGLHRRQRHLPEDLPDERRLADLTRTGHHLQEAPRPGQAPGELPALGACEGGSFAHAAEQNYSIA